MTSARILLYFFCLIQWNSVEIVNATSIQNGLVKQGSGTTTNIEDIFKGRCLEYQEIVNPSVFSSGKKNCSELWDLFSGAFMFKDPCNVTMEDYAQFVEAAFHEIPPNTHLFWEGVYPFVNKYSDRGNRYFTIADTLTGYMVDNVFWCGQVEPPGFNYDTCPEWMSCSFAADLSFWRATSELFASEAQGVAHVMLNASLDNAFSPTSVFAEHELALLNSSRVSTLRTFLVRDIGVTHKENCGAGSLAELQDITENTLGIRFECIDDPESPKHLLCVDNWEHEQCANSSKKNSHTFLMLILIFAITMAS